MSRIAVILAASLVSTSAFAQAVLKNEPPLGRMRTGEVVYVDNGKCPKGQVQKVTAQYIAGGRNSVSGAPRIRECVPTPRG